jgi:hypothetical protein
VIDRYDEMRVAPDPSLAEALRQRLHARMASVPRDDNHEGPPDLQLDAARLDPEQHLVPVTEIRKFPDSPTSEIRKRRRLAMAAAAVVAVIGVAAIAINSLSSDGEAPSPAAPPTIAPTTTATPTTVAIPTTTEPVGVPGALPDGTYRVEVTSSDLEAVNARNFRLAGTWEWTFLRGDWSYQNTSTSVMVESTYKGTYVVEGNHITFFVPGFLWTEAQGPNEFTWRVDPDGSLQFTYLASTNANWAALFGSHPLVPTT